MRSTASTTIASTAGLSPKNSACDDGTSPGSRRRAMLSTRMATKPGRTNSDARDQAAARPVQQPADVRRELLRFRAGQQHAVVERVQEARSRRSIGASLDELAVHHRDLARRSAEARAGRCAPSQGAGGLRGEARGCAWTLGVVVHLRGSRLVGRPVVGLVGGVAGPAVEGMARPSGMRSQVAPFLASTRLQD